ncbi:MAG: thiamine-monophosphate kinase, partial [Deltaproteobacteria bacterium]|nr:thiamine-monophosphate kinase [Deltaproteobacteria bacterium]
MEIREFGELRLIKRVMMQFNSPHPNVVKGIGDDAAVTVLDGNRYLLSTTDMLVEDIHFSLTYTPPHLLGKKAVAISLSDIAAMGGTPTVLLISLALPSHISTEFIDLLYNGVKERVDEFNITLIGGNTSSSPDKVIIGTTMLGEVQRDRVVFRHGARVG